MADKRSWEETTSTEKYDDTVSSAKRQRREAMDERAGSSTDITASENEEEDSDEEEEESEDEQGLADSEQFQVVSKYYKISERARKNATDLNGPDGIQKVQSSLDEVEEIFKAVKHSKDTTVIATDSNVFQQVSYQAHVVAQNVSGFSSEGIRVGEFVNAWKSLFGDGTFQNGAESYNWANAGLLYSNSCDFVQGCDFLNGPLGIEKKQKVSRERLVDDSKNKTEIKTANRKQASDVTTESKDDTSKAAEEMFKKLLEYGKPVQIIYLLDPTSFAKTIETLFVISFLVNVGRLIFNENGDGMPFVEVSTSESIKVMPRNKEDEDGKSHIVLSLDMQTWEKLVHEYEIKRPLFP